MNEFPKCPKCNKQLLLPLSDYGDSGSSVKYKAWCCADSKCGYALRIDKGKIAYETVREVR
jgi:hypothetical protein